MAEAAPLPLADALEGVETPPAELPLDGEGPSLPRDEGISSSGRGEEGGTEWHEMPFVREGSSSSPPWRRLGPPSISGEPSGSDHGGGWVSCATGTRDTALRVLSEARDAWVASWAAAQAWLTTEQQPTSRYVALIPLSGASTPVPHPPHPIRPFKLSHQRSGSTSSHQTVDAPGRRTSQASQHQADCRDPGPPPLPAANFPEALVGLPAGAQLGTPPLQMLFALILAIAVFFLVPRGISIGKITIHSDKMSWNKTLRTFQLDLNAEIPIINPNYWQARWPVPLPPPLLRGPFWRQPEGWGR